MADGRPIPGPALLTRAVEAGAANYEAAFTAGWNAAVDAAERQLVVQIDVYRRVRHIPGCELAHDTLVSALPAIRALAKETPDAPR